jgi:protein NrfD
MNGIPSSTYFSAPPDWGWLIVLYFFFGGLAGGCYFLASLIDLFGRSEDRPLSHLGYYIPFPCVILSGLLLTLDLQRPERFWHMLIESNTYRPMFKYWSPISIGSWALLIFGIFALVSFLGALADAKRIPWAAWRKVHPPSLLGRFIAAIGGIFGFYVAGYTGVLLSVTNRPIWSDTPLLGMLFIVSAASTSAALMILLAEKSRYTMPGLRDLHRVDVWVIVLEFIVLIALMISLGPVFRAWLSAWGLLLLIGVVIVGMLLPLALSWRSQWLGDWNMKTTAALILLGGFLLRLVIVFSAEGV